MRTIVSNSGLFSNYLGLEHNKYCFGLDNLKASLRFPCLGQNLSQILLVKYTITKVNNRPDQQKRSQSQYPKLRGKGFSSKYRISPVELHVYYNQEGPAFLYEQHTNEVYFYWIHLC